MTDTNETVPDPVAAMMSAELLARGGKERWWGLSDFTPEPAMTEEEGREAQRFLDDIEATHEVETMFISALARAPLLTASWTSEMERNDEHTVAHTTYEVECLDTGKSCGCGDIVDGVWVK